MIVISDPTVQMVTKRRSAQLDRTGLSSLVWGTGRSIACGHFLFLFLSSISPRACVIGNERDWRVEKEGEETNESECASEQICWLDRAMVGWLVAWRVHYGATSIRSITVFASWNSSRWYLYRCRKKCYFQNAPPTDAHLGLPGISLFLS